MVRGQVNQSSAFDSFDGKRFKRQGSTHQSKMTDLPSRSPSTPDQDEPAVSASSPAKGPARSALKSPVPDISTAKAVLLQRKMLQRVRKNWQFSFIWIGALGLFGGVGISAYFWLAGLPPLPNCKTITPLSPDAHRLYCAREMARSGKPEDLLTGITLVKNWSPNHPLYKDAQQSLTKWSKLMLLAARDKMNQNDFKGAIDAINKIPKSSPVYEDAQKTAAEWKEQWQAGESLYAKAQAAIEKQDWKDAFEQVTELGYLEHDYWRLQQADVLSKQILVQKESRDALERAKKLAKQAGPDQLGEAIVLLQTVASNTEAWTEAQQLLQTWSQSLLQTALLDWQTGDTTDAIELAQQVPLNLKLSSEAQDLVKFSHADQLVAESQIEAKLSWRHLWNLTEAITAMQQISSGSPVYAEAQARLQDWQVQLQDLQQLQFANVIADLGHKPALEYAIAQAGQIAADHQRYGQAQTLIASWKQQIEQLEDLPYLQLAQQLAATATVPNLQQAIAQARVIPTHRSLWTEVQSQIVAWQQQIERIEDQPIFDKAQKLAKDNKLDEAIVAAAEIRPNRSLYDQAQAAILTWKEKIRATEIAADRSVLDQAYNYAGSSQLTDAIAVAAQITPGRPLYLEAQSAIGAWLRERDGIKPDAPEAPAGETAETPADDTTSTTEAAEATPEADPLPDQTDNPDNADQVATDIPE